jgi:protease-4
MKKFLLGVLAGFLVTVLAGVLLLLALSFAERPAAVRDGTTLVVELSGEIPERPPVRWPLPAFEARRPLTVQQVWELLGRAATDPRVKAVALFPEDLGVGWARLDELRRSLIEFRKSGKPVWAYLRGPGGREYYVATAAEKIYLAREDMLDVKGLRAEAVYLKSTLDKLGVQVEIEHAGRYKDAGDALTRTSMRPETREVLESVLDRLYSHFVDTVASARSLPPSAVPELIDQGPFLASKAKEHRLVDELAFEDEFDERLKAKLGQERLRKLSARDYLRAAAAEAGARIAFVVAEGTIVRGGDGLEEEGVLASRSFVRLLRQIGQDGHIKGVILRINSPGGDAIASDEILREARLLAQKKPLVVSMSDAAASGGYYIAMTGSPVIASPHTFTGSIGVLYGKVNLRGLYDKLGVRKETIARGRFADIDSDYQPLSPAARQKLREGIEEVYSRFLEVVAEGRRRPVAQIRPLAEGRLWLGAQAAENGLVDELGGLDLAVARLREKAGIPATEKVTLVAYPRQRSLIDYLLRAPESAVYGQLRSLLGLDPRPLVRGGFLHLPPYTVVVR